MIKTTVKVSFLLGIILGVTMIALNGCDLALGLTGGIEEAATISGEISYEGPVPQGAVLYVTVNSGTVRNFVKKNPTFPEKFELQAEFA